MVKLLKQLLKSEQGQALPIVLCLLALGGLTITASLNYSTTCLNGSRIVHERTKGVYAAGAGVEHVLWSLKNGASPLTQLPENINGMTVNMTTENKGTSTLYFGEMIKPGANSDYLSIDSDVVWDEGTQAYRYTINVTRQHQSTIFLVEVGARIPVGFIYKPGSANIIGNLSSGEPAQTQGASGAYLLNWQLSPHGRLDNDNPTQTQTFYITGSGNPESYYAWVVADAASIGKVGEITGTFYKITVRASRPGDGRTTARIVVDLVMQNGAIRILSWQILN